MSKEVKPKRTRSTKSHTAELEAKIAELEARLANLSSQVQPGVTRSTETREAPKPQARPSPPPQKSTAAQSRGTLPAGFKPPPPPAPEPRHESPSAPQPGEVAPAYATISSTEYTGNKYYATRKRMSYHPPDKQFTGTSYTTTTRTTPPPPSPEPRPEPRVSQTRETLPSDMKTEEKKSTWRSKGAEYENYVSQETKKAPPPTHQERPSSPPPPRPTASGSTHGTLPAGMKPAPKPESKPAPQPDVVSSEIPVAAGEVAPAYATISSTSYTGNKYYATRKRMSYHPPDKQYTGSTSSTTVAPPTPEPPKPKLRRGTLPAGFKP